MSEKQVLEIHPAPQPHWVGDGFPVTSVFTMQGQLGKQMSPFLMLDYAQPTEFAPANKPRGVDSHPHKGFETVTIIYQGAVEHRDSSGASGIIGEGDVQWMTAGSGLVHEEKHEKNFTKQGGTFQVAQLWVNLQAKDKSAPPKYQTILKDEIPIVQLEDGAGYMRIIAGEYDSKKGAAQTFTPLNVFDLRLKAGKNMSLNLPEGYNSALIVQEGQVVLNGGQKIEPVTLAIADTKGEQIEIRADKDSMLLVLSGQPIDEPIAAYGPFVMNSEKEIKSAIEDFRNGAMGQLD